MVQIMGRHGDSQVAIVVDGVRRLFSHEVLLGDGNNLRRDVQMGHVSSIIYLRSGQKMWVDDFEHTQKSEAFQGRSSFGDSTYFAVTLLA